MRKCKNFPLSSPPLPLKEPEILEVCKSLEYRTWWGHVIKIFRGLVIV